MDNRRRDILPNIFLTILATIFGIFAGPAVQRLAPPLFAPSNFASITFIVVCISSIVLSIYVSVLWRSSHNLHQTISSEIQDISSKLGQQSIILPYKEANIELAKWIDNAKKEVRVTGYYFYDWSKSQDNFHIDQVDSKSRKLLFDSFTKAIQRTKSSNLRYIRITEAPSVQKFLDAVRTDELYYNECQLLCEIGKRQPERACLMVSNIYTQKTFYIIDETKLFFYIDILNPDTNKYEIPFGLLIIDPSGEQLRKLIGLHQRVEAHATLVTEMKPRPPSKPSADSTTTKEATR